MKAALLKITQGSSGPVTKGFQKVRRAIGASSISPVGTELADLRAETSVAITTSDTANKIATATNAANHLPDLGWLAASSDAGKTRPEGCVAGSAVRG